jgi:hypothetical protein
VPADPAALRGKTESHCFLPEATMAAAIVAAGGVPGAAAGCAWCAGMAQRSLLRLRTVAACPAHSRPSCMAAHSHAHSGRTRPAQR